MRNVTQKELAERLKVSQKTISRVLNNSPTVNEATRQKVLSAMAEAGYAANANAGNLRSGKRGALGVILPKTPQRSIYFNEAFRGVSDRLLGERTNLLVIAVEDAESATRKIDAAAARVDGFAVFNICEARTFIRVIETALDRWKAPRVLIQSYIDESARDYVTVDNFAGGKIAAEYLLSLGHRRLAFFGSSRKPDFEEKERLEGFSRAVEAAGAVPLIFAASLGEIDKRLQSALAGPEAPTAIFAWSDKTARAIVYELKRLKKNVPEDLSVIGFDDHPEFVDMGPPRLTTIAQPLYEIGAKAIDILLSEDARLTQRLLFKPALVERESCRRRD